MANNGNNDIYLVGRSVFILLAALTIGEFWIGNVAGSWIPILFLIAAIKAWLIVRDYMHIGRLFAGEEESH